MENAVFLLQVGDRWLNIDSLSNVAICTKLEEAISLALQDSQNNDDELSGAEIKQLWDMNHTYGRDNNYMISVIELDELI